MQCNQLKTHFCTYIAKIYIDKFIAQYYYSVKIHSFSPIFYIVFVHISSVKIAIWNLTFKIELIIPIMPHSIIVITSINISAWVPVHNWLISTIHIPIQSVLCRTLSDETFCGTVVITVAEINIFCLLIYNINGMDYRLYR